MSGCYLWTGALTKTGYPEVLYNKKVCRVARLALSEAIGFPPYKQHNASHLCDNRICVSPDHLIWELPGDNTRRESMASRRRLKTTKGYWRATYQGGPHPWQASIRINDRPIHLGYFATEEEARAAYLEAIRRLG
jgi:hypothetical protein